MDPQNDPRSTSHARDSLSENHNSMNAEHTRKVQEYGRDHFVVVTLVCNPHGRCPTDMGMGITVG